VAKRLYRLVDLKRGGATSWSTDLFDLQLRIPIGPYGYVSKIKEKLSAAHEELLEKGFVSDIAYLQKSTVVYEISDAFRHRRKGLELAGTRADFIAIKLLTESGLRGDVARDLVAKHGPERCTRYANALPHQNELRNPAGWLRRAIEEGYEIDQPPDQQSLLLQPDPDTTSKPSPTSTASDSPPEPPSPDPVAEELFEQILDDLETNEDSVSLRNWFDGTVPVSLDGYTLTLSAPNPVAQEYIERRFRTPLEEALRSRLGHNTLRLVLIYYT